MYPVWKKGDPRYRSSWTGGEVKFDVRSDAPTLSGAKVTFTIDIIIPENQLVLPNGEVVWGKYCFVNGTQHQKGESVYPQEFIDEQDAVFPDGSPLNNCENQKPLYVFVWKTCGKYWQVCDGLSSSLEISTQGIPLGSYVMDVVIYQYRKKDKFIPIGYASTQYCITDQIPFDVTLTQVNDKDEGDQTFTQNHPIAFSIAVHDPSSYLSNSDITFNWDFGDASGTVISKEPTVTHTYTKTGFFKPHVVVQAAMPNMSCSTPPNPPAATFANADFFISEGHAGSVRLISTERSYKDTTESMEHFGSINAEMKTSSQLDTNEGLMDLLIIFVQKYMRNIEDIFQDTTVMKKQQPPNSDQDCVVYRYGFFSTQITVVGKTICSAVGALPECMHVLRHVFHDSGIFCINVSMSNDVSLAVTSTRVNVNTGSRFFITGIVAIVLGVLMVALAIGTFAYKHQKLYQPLSEFSATGITCLMPSLLWNLVKQQAAPKHSVLLQQV
ncbi:melanocyte protein Pmel 17 isoform X1 [Silurus asotus]|uniref:Melanocyte protein Pmel 17 isoform X1 n=1 Tax=Silurus asotus TaxID=30991 RepID=A0AAD5A390_SILAS|nr:melanocyte protein Pmel 17 isoform X1 [Silurus asotus]